MGKFLVKLVVNVAIVASLLYFYTEADIGSAIVAGAALCLVAYVIGDQIVLRATNNTIATVADAVLAFLFLWAAAYVMDWSLSWSEMVVIVVLLAAAEVFIHRLMRINDWKGFSR